MKSLQLTNPILQSDVIDDVFSGDNIMDVSKHAFKTLAKYMVTTKHNKFIFSMKDLKTDKEYHFQGTKQVTGKNKAKLNIKRFHIKKQKGGNTFNVQLKGGGRSRSRTRNSRKNNNSDEESIDFSSDSSSYSSELSENLLKELSNTSDESYGGSSKTKKSGKGKKNSNEDTWEKWLRRRYLFPANTYFFYDPLYYYMPDYTTYIFNRNVFIPNLYYSLYPYWNTILGYGL